MKQAPLGLRGRARRETRPSTLLAFFAWAVAACDFIHSAAKHYPPVKTATQQPVLAYTEV